jgi:serine/threonine protein kinase
MAADNDTSLPGAAPPPAPVPPGPGASPVPLPKTLKQYKVIREIGSGGMGRVLKCLDTTLNRYVALKMLRPELARDEGFLERFRREALAVAKTRHPNIVQIHTIDSDAGTVFYIMEHIEGEGLDRILERRGRLPEREAVDVLRQAAEGLNHVHRAGILHRDLKPSNLIRDPSGRVVLTDFGLAKMDFQRVNRLGPPLNGRARSPAETDPDRVIGTPYYIAPECLSGREPDVRSDLYSLGVVFYEMLTGKVPFGGDSPTAIFRGHMYDIPVPIGELAPETSLRVANIAYKCIEKAPAARYQECRDLLADLNAVMADWSRDRDTQERQRQAVEIALAMGMEKKRPASRSLGRILALTMVLAALVALLLIALNALRTFPPAVLPPGSHAGDLQWAPGRSARIFGIVEAVSDSGRKNAVVLSVRRVREA